jgi:hypothetical protein
MQDQKLNNVVMQYFDSAVNLTLDDARGAATADRGGTAPIGNPSNCETPPI